MSAATSPIWRYHAALFTAALFWSLAYIGIRVGVRDFSPGAAAFFRYAVASICLLPMVFYIPWRRLSFQLFVVCLVLGWLSIAFYNLALNIAEETLTSDSAALFFGQMPVLTALMAVVFLHEKIALRGYLGFAISFIGILIMSGIFSRGINHDVAHGLPVDLLLLAILMGSVLSTVQKYLVKTIAPVHFMTLVIWSGTLYLSVFGSELWHELPKATLSCDAWVVFNGIFPAAIAYCLWGVGLSRVPLSVAVGYLYFMPVFGVLSGWLILGELPKIYELYGAVIAFVGSFIVTRARSFTTSAQPISPQASASSSSSVSTETLSTVC